MDNTIIVAAIAAGAAVLSSLLSAYGASRLVIYRIEQLEKKVELHNKFDRRLNDLECFVQYTKK